MSIFYQKRPEDFRCILSRNNTFAPHLHRHIELILVLSGTIEVAIDKNRMTLEKHMGCIIFPNQIHSLYTSDSSQILLFIFDVNFCPSYKTTFLTKLPVFQLLSTQKLSFYGHSALQSIYQLWIQPTVLPFSYAVHTQYTQGFLQVLLTGLLSQLSFCERTECAALELSQQVLMYIEAHYTEALTLDVLSKEFLVSRFTISRIFSEKLHLSFSAYLTTWRLEKAKDLLQTETGFTVTDIAYEAGFLSTRTFFRAFYDTYGITPKQFQAEHHLK